MEKIQNSKSSEHKLWKKILSLFLAVIIGFGTIVTLTVGSSHLKDLLGIQSMLSVYAAEIVDTDGAVAVDEESMLADHHTINLENKDGSNTVYLFSEPISYTDGNGNLKTKDISVEKQTDKELKNQGYDYTNGQNDYRINFSSNSEKGLNVQFDKCTYSIIPESNISVSGSKGTAEFLNEEFEVFEYENIYGSGTTLRFYPQLNGVKEEIVLDSNIGQNSFSFFIKTDNCTAVLNDDGTVSLISNNDDTAVQTFSAPFAYDSEYVEGDYDEHYIDCNYELKDNSNGEYILTVTVDKNWLDSDSTVYPVVIDPTTSNVTSSADVSIYQNKGTNNYGNEQTCCFGYTTEYGIGRAYTKFTVPSAIKKGAVINSAYQWMRETTGRTNSTYIKPFMVTSSWSETGIYWNNRPSHNLSVVGTRRNINSNSTDDPSNKYWYKFDLKNAVKKWVDGATNYGVTYISEEEQRKSYEWRAFTSRTYSSSAMRPYTVINYTNDTTAPTVTSVTGNAASWTKNNVTLTVNGAKDNSGGAGLHSTPYSFSTTKGSYSWQKDNKKTFSSNCTVYVYVRDAIGNIRLVSTQTINKIDKTAPNTPSVSGNPTDWTDSSVTLTASSSDSASGVKDYSFSSTAGTYSWQSSNTKTFNENQTVYVYARDNAGNISAAQTVNITKIAADESYFLPPEIYQDGNMVGIINPRCNDDPIAYRINNGEVCEYTAPFVVSAFEPVTITAFFGDNDASATFTTTPDSSAIGRYSENAVDFSLNYKTASFDFARTYNSTDKAWFTTLESEVTKESEYLFRAVLPNGESAAFAKTAADVYTNQITGDTLTLDDAGYIIQIDDINYCYDANGILSSVGSKYGDTITITRTASAVTIADGADRAYTLALDSNGNIASVTDPANNTITYTYDTSGNLIKVVDQAGVTIGRYSYTNGVLTKSMDKTIVYASNGRVRSYEYDSGAYLNYVYDDSEKKISTESSVETSASYNYNDTLQVVSSTDDSGNITEFGYDISNRLIYRKTSEGTVNYEYDGNGRISSINYGENNENNAAFTYNGDGQIIRQQIGEDYTYFEYNADGTIALTATLKSTYNGEIPENYESSLTCFDTISYTYDNGMLVKSVDNEKSKTTTYTYNEYGFLVKKSTIEENGNKTFVTKTENTFDIVGRLVTTVSGEKTAEYIYDPAGRILYASDDGEISRSIYDENGRIIQLVTTEDYKRELDGLPEENTYADSKAGHTYVYADNGTLASETNRIGKTIKYFYNDNGSVICKEFDIYKLYYLNHGECYQVEIDGAPAVTYSYDEDYNLIDESYANGGERSYEYSGDKLYKQYFDGDENRYAEYTYDKYGVTKIYNSTSNYTRQRIGTDAIIMGSGCTEIENFDYGAVTTRAENNTGLPATVKTRHFNVNNIHSTTYDENRIDYSHNDTAVHYFYESDDICKYHSNIESDIMSFDVEYYYDNDNVTEKYYNMPYRRIGFVTDYDDKDRIKSYGTDEYTRFYSYDDKNQLVSVENTEYDYISNYEYDDRGNILSKDVNGEVTEFSYAATGWIDQLTAVNGVELTYDENGNPLTYGDREYNWNTGRNLESIVDGENEYSYTYDENGIRTSKTVNGVTTYYNTSNGVVLSQKDDDGNIIVFQYDESGVPFGMVLNDEQFYYITNAQGDVVGIADRYGEVIAYYSYNEWGELIEIKDVNYGYDIAEINPLRYRGYYYDNETGYYYLQSRYYDPSICRFINADLFAFLNLDTPFGINLYAYCYNNPINFSDPTGFYIIAEDEQTNNWFEAVLKTLVISIEIDAITRAFESLVKSVNKAFDLNKWFEDLSEINQEIVTDISLGMASYINTLYIEIKESIDFSNLIKEINTFLVEHTIDGLINELINKINFGRNEYNFFNMWKTFAGVFNTSQESKLTTEQTWVLFITNMATTVLSIMIPEKAIMGTVINCLGNIVFSMMFNYQNGHLWG